MATHSLSEKMQRRCLWKLDLLLMPILTVYGSIDYDLAFGEDKALSSFTDIVSLMAWIQELWPAVL